MKAIRSCWAVLLALFLLLSQAVACRPGPVATKPAPAETPVPTPTPASTPQPELTPTPEPTPLPRASFSSGPCQFALPPGQVESETVECGTLTVPEDRTEPTSPTISLAVAIFHPGTSPEPDPIIYLTGGPGGSELEFVQFNFAQLFQPLLAANRDIVIFDQRGVGLSRPALDCPMLQELGLDLMDQEIGSERVSEEEAADLIKGAVLTCRQDLGKVAELSAYETAASAADVEDLRQALGYDRVNLWGTSYGTWLALEVMRRFPGGIRSVVLDGVYPPDVDLLAETPANAARSIDLLFETCASDEACSTAFPDLRAIYSATVAELNQDPTRFQVTDPLTRQSYGVLMTGDNLVGFLFQFLYETTVIPSLPQILYDASQGDYAAVAQLMGSVLAVSQGVSKGQQLSVLCHDEIAFGSAERLEEAYADQPELRKAFKDSIVGEMGIELCQAWQVGQADATVTQAVTSGLPTLIMTGEFDPVTPPAWGRHVAETLANAYFYEYPGVGHGASAVAGCPQEMMLAFWDAPASAPDDDCIEGMRGWRFVVPTAPETIQLVPFTNASMGIRGSVPKGWKETAAQSGVYSRGRSGLDATLVVVQAAPTTASGLQALLTQQLGLTAEPQSVGQRQANGLTWNLYTAEVQGLSIDWALAESATKALVVVLQSNPKERDSLYEAAFLPVIEALEPIE